MKERLLTPQQELFLSLYTNPTSATFSNALQSGLKAGYSQEYSEVITTQLPEWLSENLGRLTLLKKAEKVLNKTLDMETVDEDGRTNTTILAIQNKTATFIAETQGKNVGYSKRTEHTGENGNPIAMQITGMKIIRDDEDKA